MPFPIHFYFRILLNSHFKVRTWISPDANTLIAPAVGTESFTAASGILVATFNRRIKKDTRDKNTELEGATCLLCSQAAN